MRRHSWFVSVTSYPHPSFFFSLRRLSWLWGFPGSSAGKESAYNAEDLGSVPGLGISPGGGHGNPDGVTKHSLSWLLFLGFIYLFILYLFVWLRQALVVAYWIFVAARKIFG